MNYNCTRLLARFSTTVVKTHCRKLCKSFAGTLPKSSLAPHSRSFSWHKEVPEDSKDDFELFEDSIEPNYQDANVEEITGGDPEKIKLLNVCQMEINMLAQNGGQVPKTMTTDFWRELINIPGHMQRVSFMKFLWLKEVKRNNTIRKKMKKHEEYIEWKTAHGSKDRAEIPTNAPVKYGLSDTCLVNRFRDVRINRFYNYKLLQAMMYGPHIIVDCGYEPFMSHREMNLCAKQLLYMWSENRDNLNPFDLIFCNFKETSPVFQKLAKTLVGIDSDPTLPFNYTDKHYLDLFPRENLVYLTPHCNEVLKEFNGNDIYIIGAMVDKSHSEPISIARAKKDRIRYAKFPLDLYLNWKMGVKSLTLNQSLAIMNDIKDGRDWSYAFRHVPKRKLNNYSMDETTREVRDKRHTAKSIRESFRRNLVYDLLTSNPKK